MSTYVDETIAKYEKYINPAQAKLFRFMGLDSVEAKAEGWIISDSEGQESIALVAMACLLWAIVIPR